MKKFFAMSLLTLLVGTATVAPSLAAPFDHHNGPDFHGSHGAMMRRGGGGGPMDIRRQEALVNQLQERVDRDRKFKRTKTSMYERNLADLRAAQAQLKAMEVRR